jgi:hypothetical protein
MHWEVFDNRSKFFNSVLKGLNPGNATIGEDGGETVTLAVAEINQECDDAPNIEKTDSEILASAYLHDYDYDYEDREIEDKR